MESYEAELARLEQKIDAVYASSEKVRKYLLTTLIITVVTIVLPIVIALLALPALLSTIGSMYGV